MIFKSNSLLIFKILIPLALASIVFLLCVLAKKYYDQYTSKAAMDKALEQQFTADFSIEERPKITLSQKWNRYWSKRLIDSGMNVFAVRRDNAGKMVLIISGAMFVILSFLLKFQFLGAALITVAVVVVLSLVLDFKANKRIEKISLQIPPFLSAILAGLQTSSVYRQVLLDAIATTPEELHAELAVIEDQLKAGGDVKQVLDSNYPSLSIAELRFLMICIIIAQDVGKDLDEQVKKIQKIVDERQRIRREKDQAKASIMPTVWTATIFLPALFLYTYISQPIARQFWFHGLLSWIILLVILALYASGLFVSKKMLDKIDEM